MQQRGFDFSLDIEVINLLGRTLFDLGNLRDRQQRGDESNRYYTESIVQFQKTLQIDPENVSAHHNLHLLYEKLDDQVLAAKHQQLHLRYKPDDNAQGPSDSLGARKVSGREPCGRSGREVLAASCNEQRCKQ